MWDLPRPGIEPVSPALAGGFLTTVPPGKPQALLIVPEKQGTLQRLMEFCQKDEDRNSLKGPLLSNVGTISASKIITVGFPGGAVVETLPANAGDTGSSPGLGRSHMPRSNWAREP